MRSDNLYELPNGIPAPIDDGGADHLAGQAMPSIPLRSTAGPWVNLSNELGARIVLFCYPRTGMPDRDPPEGWNSIPGARGCTPECMAFRDLYREFQRLDCRVFGLSTQSTEYQKEVVARLGLPFEVLSDSQFLLTRALGLPTFEVAGMTLLKRLTLIIRGGLIEHVFYPVFPPNLHARETLEWLSLMR